MLPDAWSTTPDLGTFRAHAGAFLRSRPALHTLQLTVVEALRTQGTTTYGDQAPHFAWLGEGDAGSVRAAALRTPPYPLSLTATSAEAADALAARLADEGHALPGVIGPADTARDFAAAWERRTEAAARPGTRSRLYRLGTLTTPDPAPPGRARIADRGDLGLVARWYTEFSAEADHGRPMQDPERWAGARIAHGGITLWETPAGTPVAMAGSLPKVAGQIRVAPVYTPSDQRGRGYAGAVTVEVSRAASAAGAQEVLLFTDLANATSNALYQRLGYRAVTDFAQYDFVRATAAP